MSNVVPFPQRNADGSPGAPATCPPSTGAGFGTLLVTGILATAIVMWIRGRAEETEQQAQLDRLAAQLEEHEALMQAEREAAELELLHEQAEGYR